MKIPDIVPGPEIERKSFEIIEQEVGTHSFDKYQWPVVRRIIHASGDLSIAKRIKFGGNPIKNAAKALKKCSPIISDTNMAIHGISIPKLKKVNPSYERSRILCAVSMPEVIELSQKEGIPRSVFNIRHFKNVLEDSIVVIGNAPTALWEVIRLFREENLKPACVIAMPVGFVNVVEVKEMLINTDLDYITVLGRRGGTPMAVATLNALADLASSI